MANYNDLEREFLENNHIDSFPQTTKSICANTQARLNTAVDQANQAVIGNEVKGFSIRALVASARIGYDFLNNNDPQLKRHMDERIQDYREKAKNPNLSPEERTNYENKIDAAIASEQSYVEKKNELGIQLASNLIKGITFVTAGVLVVNKISPRSRQQFVNNSIKMLTTKK